MMYIYTSYESFRQGPVVLDRGDDLPRDEPSLLDRQIDGVVVRLGDRGPGEIRLQASDEVPCRDEACDAFGDVPLGDESSQAEFLRFVFESGRDRSIGLGGGDGFGIGVDPELLKVCLLLRGQGARRNGKERGQCGGDREGLHLDTSNPLSITPL